MFHDDVNETVVSRDDDQVSNSPSRAHSPRAMTAARKTKTKNLSIALQTLQSCMLAPGRANPIFEAVSNLARASSAMGLQGFVEGGLASIAAGCTTHPLDLIKVRMQLQGEIVPTFKPAFALATPPLPQHHPAPCGPFAIAARIIHTEGVPALFSGVSATVLRQTLYSSTRLGLYEVLTRRWSSSEKCPPVLQKIAAGLIAGGVGAAVGNPADVALVRMQADGRLPYHMRRNYCGVGDALFQMVRQEGIISLWRGSSLTVQRAMVVTASQLATYDQVKEGLLHHHRVKDGVALHVTASCIAGLVASAASNPLDVIKTRIMNMTTEPGRHPVYGGALDCAMKTVNLEGLMSLYKGFAPTVMRQGPYTVVLFVTLEQIKRLFGHS